MFDSPPTAFFGSPSPLAVSRPSLRCPWPLCFGTPNEPWSSHPCWLATSETPLSQLPPWTVTWSVRRDRTHTHLFGNQRLSLQVFRLCLWPWGWSLPLEDGLAVVVLQASSGVPSAYLRMFCMVAVGSLDAPEKPSLDLS